MAKIRSTPPGYTDTGYTKTTGSEHIIWDSEVAGLGQRHRNGKVTWIIQRRIDGKTRKNTLGPYAGMPVELARDFARGVLQSGGRAKTALPPRITVTDFSTLFLQECKGQWKDATYKTNARMIKCMIAPRFGQTPVAAIAAPDVMSWYTGPNYAPASATRALTVLSSMMRHAEIRGIRTLGQNPCQGLRRRHSDFKASYLDAKGWCALGKALAAFETARPVAVAFIRFLALTGCRRGEAHALQWSMIDGNRIALPDAKAGPKSIWLGHPVKQLLASLPRTGAFVFMQDAKPLSVAHINTLWHLLRETMQRKSLRLHDLRHSYASTAINLRVPLRTISGLLGHADINATAGYAHLEQAPVQNASRRVGAHLHSVFPIAHPKPKKKKPVKDEHAFKAFTRSKLCMADFCKQEKLDIEHFRAALVAWRKCAPQPKRGGLGR